MANPNAPFGLRALRHLTGGTIRPSEGYTIANAYNTAIGYGQIVQKTGTGMDIAVGANDTVAKIGVFAGCFYRDQKGNSTFSPNWVASTATFQSEGARALVFDDPQTVFLVRTAGASTPDVAATDIGQFAGLVVGTVDTGTGVSRNALDGADITGTADVFKILKLYDDGRNAYGDYALVEVLLGIHENRAPAAS